MFSLISLFTYVNNEFTLVKAQDGNQIINTSNLIQYENLLLEPLAQLIEKNLLEIEIANKFNNADPEGGLETNSFSIINLNKFQMEEVGPIKHSATLVRFVSENIEDTNNDFLGLQIIDPLPLRDVTYQINNSKQKQTLTINTPINGCREINIENIEDEIFDGPITFADFFQNREFSSLWESEVVTSKSLLVPTVMHADSSSFSNVDKEVIEKEEVNKFYSQGQCNIDLLKMNYRSETSDKKFVSNYKKSKVLMIQRPVNIVKRRPKSPFLNTGFEIIAFDKIGNLPRIKLVYDSKLNFSRGTFYYWKKSSLSGSDKIVLEGTLSFDGDMKSLIEANVVEAYENFNFDCLQKKLKSYCSNETSKP